MAPSETVFLKTPDSCLSAPHYPEETSGPSVLFKSWWPGQASFRNLVPCPVGTRCSWCWLLTDGLIHSFWICLPELGILQWCWWQLGKGEISKRKRSHIAHKRAITFFKFLCWINAQHQKFCTVSTSEPRETLNCLVNWKPSGSIT